MVEEESNLKMVNKSYSLLRSNKNRRYSVAWSSNYVKKKKNGLSGKGIQNRQKKLFSCEKQKKKIFIYSLKDVHIKLYRVGNNLIKIPEELIE